MASTTITLNLGSDPQLEATVKVNATINSSNQVKFACSYTLDALSSPKYWGFGVIIQARTRKYDTDAGAWGTWSSWGSKTIIAENDTTWSATSGSFNKTVSGCTNGTNAQIQLRLRDVGADYNTTYNEVAFTPDVVQLNVLKGSNIASVSKSPNQTYHINGDSITVNCTLATATGYQIEFKNWTTNTSGVPSSTSQKYTFNVSDLETINITANATKTANSGTIYYYPNGGVANSNYPLLTSGDYVGASSRDNSFTYESTNIDLWNPSTLFTKTGYHHESAKAWRLGSSTATTYLNCDGQNMSSYVKDKTGVVLKAYANWVANTYTVKYNANGGYGTMSDTSHTYDTAKTLSTNTFKKSGYKFIGWATSANGEVVYEDGVSVTNLTAVDGATVTLYAVWDYDNLCYYGVKDSDNNVTYKPCIINYCPDGVSYHQCMMLICKDTSIGWEVTGI